MKTHRPQLSLVALLALLLGGCSFLLPDYDAQVEQQEHALQLLDAERAALADQAAELEAAGAAAEEVAAVLERRAELKGQAVALEQSLESFKATSIGGAGSKVLELLYWLLGGTALGGTALGAKVLAMANQAKAGPSRAQGEVDELWEKLAEERARVEYLIGRIDAGLNKPLGAPAEGIAVPVADGTFSASS